jgi:hypothetical protein
MRAMSYSFALDEDDQGYVYQGLNHGLARKIPLGAATGVRTVTKSQPWDASLHITFNMYTMMQRNTYSFNTNVYIKI